VVALVKEQHLGPRQPREPLSEHRAREPRAHHDHVVVVLEGLPRLDAVLAPEEHARLLGVVCAVLPLLVPRVPRGEPVGAAVAEDAPVRADELHVRAALDRVGLRLEEEEEHEADRQAHHRSLGIAHVRAHRPLGPGKERCPFGRLGENTGG
jgi:hypothetical protein